ncbi:hypothetical protein [Pseudoroseomonas ludipueritiae]|uniref:Uncharacterized protein n=1 Tax=Pseudoroseomonas ludipueritiae TaxID=198093 RepID=A0ABR7R340_9PROT|nr:hypothetical protein [Pseudoroseomonas ludipueritiae]MBC9176138.1 hypothetical protein [Pseudoroseomonas ludipueritiae]
MALDHREAVVAGWRLDLLQRHRVRAVRFLRLRAMLRQRETPVRAAAFCLVTDNNEGLWPLAEAAGSRSCPHWIRTVLADYSLHFTTPGNTASLRPATRVRLHGGNQF